MRALAPLPLALAALACTASPVSTPSPASPPGVAATEPAAPPAPSAPAPPPISCARAGSGIAPASVDPGGGGAAVALARFGERAVAFVADEEDEAIHTVDLDARAAVARTPLAGRPGAVLVLGDGRVVASLRDRGALEILEPVEPAAPLARRCLVPVATEPVGLALTPDGATLLVASRWGHALSAFAARDLAPLGQLDLPRDPAAVITSADGRLAFVSHAVGGRVSAVELGERGAPARARELSMAGVEWRRGAFRSKLPPFSDSPKPSSKPRRPLKKKVPPTTRVERRGSQGFALARGPSGAVFAPIALVDPGASGGPSGGYGGAETGTVISKIAVIDPRGERAEVPAISGSPGLPDCRLPRAAAVDPQDELLLVTCLGHDALLVFDARDGAPRDLPLARVPVGAGPTGLAVDAAGRRAVVFARFDGAVAIAPLGHHRRAAPRLAALPQAPGPRDEVAVVKLPRARAEDAPVALGRAIFHAAGGRRVAFDGRACASCHPDGRDDGLTWVTPEGPRQTPMLLGRLDGTAPYGWEGDKKDLPSHFARTMSRLAGTGLTLEERDAVFAYLQSLAPPRGPEALDAADRAALLVAPPADPEAAALRARGEELFHEPQAGCSSCHIGDDLTTDGARHDVGSAARSDAIRAFETPSLRFIARSAPYYHDGRYPTLRALIDGVDGAMGHTAHLDERDREALAAFLGSL